MNLLDGTGVPEEQAARAQEEGKEPVSEGLAEHERVRFMIVVMPLGERATVLEDSEDLSIERIDEVGGIRVS